MSGLAAIVHWQGRPACARELRRMLEVIGHRGPDGPELETAGEVGLGHARLALGAAGERQRQPVWLPDRSAAVIADARLCHRERLRAALGRVGWPREPSTDAALILAGYERWQEGVVSRLEGDFAFAIWDSRRRLVLAARDPFGAKPLFYARTPDSLYLGSEPKQLLILPAIPVEPDPRSVARFLLDRMGAGERTYFRGVERVRAGHLLTVGAGRSGQRPYWEPGVEPPLPGGSRAAYRARLRELLLDAVEQRLRTGSPTVFELSGGLDSSSLVAAAGAVYRRASGAPPDVTTLSAVFPGREFDESPWIDAVAIRAPFAHHRISPFGEEALADLAEEVWIADSPDADPGAAWKQAAADVLGSLGAQVLISGLGGDELFWDPDYLPDLLARRRWALALRWCAARPGRLPPALAGALATSRRRVERLPRSRLAALPEWLRPDLVEEPAAAPGVEAAGARPGFSRAQRTLLDWLSDPRFHYVVEQNEVRWSRRSIELGHPFFDRRLVEFVLATPIEVRASMGGTVKSYLASAMAADLPRRLLDRNGKTSYDGYYGWLAARSAEEVRGLLLAERHWACEPYVRPRAFRSLLERTAGQDDSWDRVRPLWAVACLEVWLRQLARYEKIGSGKDEVPEQMEANRKDAPEPRASKQPYAKPELRKLGHMSEVTRKSGGGVDGGNPNQRSMT